jgi:3-phenylpropionate/trans-cinnamate dioxygenase ferredoxin reductase subunit
MPARVVIVGGGEGAAEVAAGLRMGGYGGRVTIVGEEPVAPYQRPPLSKAFLAGEVGLEKLYARAPRMYVLADIELASGVRVRAIERGDRRVVLEDGRRLAYDRLVLATGGRARRLSADGAEAAYRAPNVHELRTVDDARRLRAELRPGRRLVIVGGGYVGLEVAATAIRLGATVTVLEALPRVLARVTAPAVSAFYEQVHCSAGVDVRTDSPVAAFRLGARDSVEGVVCADGTYVAADAIVIGVGLTPNVELALDAGLAVEDGIAVDSCCRTSDPDILAVGDCTSHPCAYLGRRVRLESVPSTMAQARAAASELCGNPRPNVAVPWFWSDQYDLKLQMVGLSAVHDEMVLRGDPAARSFLALYLRDGRLIAADAVCRPREFGQARKLIAAGPPVDPDALADESAPLTVMVAEAA